MIKYSMKTHSNLNLKLHKNNGQLRYRAKRRLRKDINLMISQYGFFWNRSKLARKHNISHTTVNNIASEIIQKKKNMIRTYMIIRIESKRKPIAWEMMNRCDLRMPYFRLLKKVRKYDNEISKILLY